MPEKLSSVHGWERKLDSVLSILPVTSLIYVAGIVPSLRSISFSAQKAQHQHPIKHQKEMIRLGYFCIGMLQEGKPRVRISPKESCPLRLDISRAPSQQQVTA